MLYMSYTHSVKVILYRILNNIVHETSLYVLNHKKSKLQLSHLFMWTFRIFHLWHLVSTKKFWNLEYVNLEFSDRDAQPMLEVGGN